MDDGPLIALSKLVDTVSGAILSRPGKHTSNIHSTYIMWVVLTPLVVLLAFVVIMTTINTSRKAVEIPKPTPTGTPVPTTTPSTTPSPLPTTASTAAPQVPPTTAPTLEPTPAPAPSATSAAPVTVAVSILCPPSASSLPRNAQLTTCAWNAFVDAHFEDAIALADECIITFGPEAQRKQQEFTDSGNPSPPVGSVQGNAKQAILERGVLNDVATCYFIQGESLRKVGRMDEAKGAYRLAEAFPDARAWDQKVDSFWSPAQAAADRLSQLP